MADDLFRQCYGCHQPIRQEGPQFKWRHMTGYLRCIPTDSQSPSANPDPPRRKGEARNENARRYNAMLRAGQREAAG